jgi:hypothetical protein
MDTKTLLVNFVTTFVATFLAIALFVALHRPPQPPMPEHMPPMPPSATQQLQPGRVAESGQKATKVGVNQSPTAAPAPNAEKKATEPAKK